jgi:hypothetical protein
MRRGIIRVTRLLLFVLGCSAFLLIAGPAGAEDAPGAISQSVQRVTDAAGDGARESGGAGDSDARDGAAGRRDGGEGPGPPDGSAGRPHGGEYTGSQDSGSNLDASNATDRGGDSGSNQVDSAADHSSRFADDVSGRVDEATDASSHAGEGVEGAPDQTESATHEASHQIESKTHDISDADESVVASSRDHPGDHSVRADDATWQVEEALDATHEAPARVAPSAPRPEHRDEGAGAGSSDAGVGTGLATEAVLVNPRDGEVVTQATANVTEADGRPSLSLDPAAPHAAAEAVTEAAATAPELLTNPAEATSTIREAAIESLEARASDATEALSEAAATATEAVTERAGTVSAIGDRVTEGLDAPRTRAASTLVQHTESLAATATEAIVSATRDGESFAKRLGSTVGGPTQSSFSERLELNQGYVAEVVTAARASTLQVGSDAAQGAATLFESTGTEASVGNPPIAVGEDLADATRTWMHLEADAVAAVSHGSSEGLPPADEYRAPGERVAVGSSSISVVRRADPQGAAVAGTPEATGTGVAQGSEVRGAPFPTEVAVVISRPPSVLLPAGLSPAPIPELPESVSWERFIRAVWTGASTDGLPSLPNAPPGPTEATTASSTSLSESTRAWGGGSDTAAMIGDLAALLAPMLLGLLFLRGHFARSPSLPPPAAPG